MTDKHTLDPTLEIARSLGRIEGRIEQAFATQAQQTQVLDNHERRIGTLEGAHGKAKSWIAGAMAVATVLAVIIGWLVEKVWLK